MDFKYNLVHYKHLTLDFGQQNNAKGQRHCYDSPLYSKPINYRLVVTIEGKADNSRH